MSLPRRVMFGASVTRLSLAELHDKVPYIVIDGEDNAAHGGTYYQTDGRGLRTPPANGGLTMWQGYQDEIVRGVLRANTSSRDWVIMEMSLGTEDLTLDEPVIDDICASVIANNFRLAWVIPHVYYGAKTQVQIDWNARIRSILQAKVSQVPDSVLIDWDAIVEAWTANTSQSVAEAANGGPLLYDGRHPKGTSANPGRGCTRLACAVQAATGL